MKPDFDSREAQILGISFDSRDDNARFAEQEKFNFPLLCDTSRSVGMAYGACDNPTAGTARRISYLIGPDGRVLRAYPKVDPPKHPAEVLADLRAAPQ
jgi:peroxiredoxin Q/BCP